MREEIGVLNERLERRADFNTRLYIIGSVLKEGTQTRYEILNPQEILIDETVQSWFYSSTKELLNKINDFDVVNINEVDELGEGIKRYIELHQLSELNEWQHLIRNHVENAHTTINRSDFKPKAYLAWITTGDTEFFLVKSISEASLLKHKTILKLGRGVYELEVDPNRQLFIDEDWDGLLCNNKVLLVNENRIITLFKYYEKFKEAAEATIMHLDSIGFITNSDQFLNFVQGQVTLQRKLARASNYPVDRIRIERIQELINSGELQLKLNDTGQIECTTKEEAKAVIDVLLDNFVSSLLTDERYRALNKAKLG